MKHSTAAKAILAIGLTAASATADEHPLDRYRYEFKDDLVHSDVSDGHVPRLRVRDGAPRVLLLRPRTSFVYEMVKSTGTL